MEATCLNCNTEIVQNFCSNCGQKKYKRIDRKYIWDEVQYSTVHMNKGFLYSIKNILINPGKTARTFIDGNRVNHYKPIALTFVLAGISSFISYKLIGLNEVMEKTMSPNETINTEWFHEYMSFVQTYNAFLILLMIPFFAVFTRWAFKAWGHNYYEHVVVNSYILSYYIILNLILVYPFTYIFKENGNLVMIISQAAMLSFLIILPYFFKNFYPEHSMKNILLRLLIFIGLSIGLGIVLFIATIIGAIVYIKFFSPETLQLFVPKKPGI
ncbi:DUF3667 domain-containing protein [Flavobacterium antarcticum]|uniref:DUF3667 domain-containing protein n=1 Tax=Flavobacterium antarcticum TaxID=271155 RepID=UPI0003F9033B|nr:DUF3667 domain-containing protein [Flavobacterium antarcticum]